MRERNCKGIRFTNFNYNTIHSKTVMNTCTCTCLFYVTNKLFFLKTGQIIKIIYLFQMIRYFHTYQMQLKLAHSSKMDCIPNCYQKWVKIRSLIVSVVATEQLRVFVVVVCNFGLLGYFAPPMISGNKWNIKDILIIIAATFQWEFFKDINQRYG